LTTDQQNFSFNFDYDTNDNNSRRKSKFIIEERRRLVAKLWAQSKTETEIARELHCNVSTICRDIKFLKKLSQQFVFYLAKDLGFYYKGCIDTMDQIQQKCWNIYNDDRVSQKDKLLALKIIKETCESKFSLIEKGPSVMALNSLQERVEKIEVSNTEFR
jgi:hypothetical protein